MACLRLKNEVDMRTRHAISVLTVNLAESRIMWKMGSGHVCEGFA